MYGTDGSMRGISRGLDEIPAGFGPSAVTVGNFDGVHLGHQAILRSVADVAAADSMASVALTFDPHPLHVVAPGRAPQTLTGMHQRAALIRGLGIDRVAVVPFTREISLLSPRQFAERILARRLGARHVVVGANFRFGCNQSGDVETLQALGRELGFEVELAPTVLVGGQPASSTRVRDLVRRGEVSKARHLLGRIFSLHGTIVKGEGIGTKKTVPTLNLEPDSEVLPADGVYVTLAKANGAAGARESVTNVGMRPTFGGQHRTIETFLLGPVEDKPPDAIELGFLRKIRDERKFPSAESLREQIETDIRVAARFFERLRAPSPASAAVS